jgi:hypothetical protein
MVITAIQIHVLGVPQLREGLGCGSELIATLVATRPPLAGKAEIHDRIATFRAVGCHSFALRPTALVQLVLCLCVFKSRLQEQCLSRHLRL